MNPLRCLLYVLAGVGAASLFGAVRRAQRRRRPPPLPSRTGWLLLWSDDALVARRRPPAPSPATPDAQPDEWSSFWQELHNRREL